MDSNMIRESTLSRMPANELEKKRLLLVRVGPVNKAVFQITFRGMHDIFMARTSEEALLIARQNSPDLMVIDISEDAESGGDLSLLRVLLSSRATHGIPIVLLCGAAQEGEAAKGLTLGAVDFVMKPLSPLVLSARIQRHLELKAAHDKLAQSSVVDPVSGAASLSYFQSYCEREWRWAHRLKTPLSVAVIDLDSFRMFNDIYGNEAADSALRYIAMSLSEEMKRPGDLLARYYGGQFAAIFPDTDTDGAVSVVSRMKARVDWLQLPFAENSAGYVSVTAGLASIVPEAREGFSVLLSRAERALGMARMAGRNCYHAYSEKD